MELPYLYCGSLFCVVFAALLAAIAVLLHKRRRALHILTAGVYFALLLLFLLKSRIAGNALDMYSLLIAADYSMDVFLRGYAFEKFPEFAAQVMGRDYRPYAATLFVLAPVLTFSNVLALFQTTIDRIRYVVYPGTKYILSELNAESLALAESIRKEKTHAQIVFAGVGNGEKKSISLLENARKISALCLPRSITMMKFGNPFQKKLIFLICKNEPKNVADAIALTEKYKNTRQQMEIYVYASSNESRLAIDAADKGNRCLHPRFRNYLSQHLPAIFKENGSRHWEQFARILENAPLEGGFSVCCVDPVEQTVRNVLTENYQSIHEKAKTKDKVVGITILGFGNHGATLLKNAAWMFQLYGYRLQINVFDLDGSARKYLQQKAPELRFDYSRAYEDEASHDILFMGEDRGIDCFCSDFDELFLHTHWQRLQATQLVFVSLGDDSKNITAATHIRELFQRKQIEAALAEANLTGSVEEKENILKNLQKQFEDPASAGSPLIFAVVTDRNRSANLISSAAGTFGDRARCNYHIQPVGVLSDTYDFRKLLKQKELEKSALKNHLCWSIKAVMNSGHPELHPEILNDLVENAEKYVRYAYYRDSSLATTLHRQLLKTVEKELEELVTEAAPDVAEVKKITEHMRWNAYMRATGYRQYDVRNDRVKLHPLMVPYQNLEKKERSKDLIEF